MSGALVGIMAAQKISAVGGTAPTIRSASGVGANGASQTRPQPVSGNYYVAWVFDFSPITTGFADTAGNTWTAKKQQADSNSNYVNLFTAPVTATGSGTNTFTSGSGGSIQVTEVQGNLSSTPDDGTITGGTFTGSIGGTLSAGAITTTAAASLILSAAIDQNSATLVANSGTLVASGVGQDFNIVQQRTTSSAGSYTESFTVPISVNETAAIVAIAIKGT